MVNQNNQFILQKKRSLIETLGSLSLFERKLLNIALRQASSPLIEAIDKGSCDTPIRVTMMTADILSLLDIDARSLPNLKTTGRTLTSARFTFNVFVRKNQKTKESQVMQQTSTIFTRIMVGSKTCEFSINPDILPFISKDDLTALLDLRIQAKFTSKYAQMIWELCSIAVRDSNDDVLSEVFHINSFRKYLNLEDSEYYQSNARLMNKIIKPACLEVSKLSNLEIQCLPQKQGRLITSLCFHIKVKKSKELSEEMMAFFASTEGLLLKRLEFSNNRIQEMISQYGVEYIQNKVNHLKSRIADKDKPPIKSPVGWLENCILKDWSNPYAGRLLVDTIQKVDIQTETLKEELETLQKELIETCSDELPMINKEELEIRLEEIIRQLKVGGESDYIKKYEQTLKSKLLPLLSEYTSESAYIEMLKKDESNKDFFSTKKLDTLSCSVRIYKKLLKAINDD